MSNFRSVICVRRQLDRFSPLLAQPKAGTPLTLGLVPALMEGRNRSDPLMPHRLDCGQSSLEASLPTECVRVGGEQCPSVVGVVSIEQTRGTA
jgi:hypothetical protein